MQSARIERGLFLLVSARVAPPPVNDLPILVRNRLDGMELSPGPGANFEERWGMLVGSLQMRLLSEAQSLTRRGVASDNLFRESLRHHTAGG